VKSWITCSQDFTQIQQRPPGFWFKFEEKNFTISRRARDRAKNLRAGVLSVFDHVMVIRAWVDAGFTVC